MCDYTKADFLNSTNNENMVHPDRKYKFATRGKWSTWHQISYLQVPGPCKNSLCRDTRKQSSFEQTSDYLPDRMEIPLYMSNSYRVHHLRQFQGSSSCPQAWQQPTLPTESPCQQKTCHLCNPTNGSRWTWTAVTINKSLKWKIYSKHHVVGKSRNK